MPQLVFIHGPGASGTAAAWKNQLNYFPGSVAPTLPGNLEGTHCPDVVRNMEWVRGWLWAQGLKKDLVLVGYTLGSAVALQYGLDYPDEVKGLILTSVEATPRTGAAWDHQQERMKMRLKAAAGDADTYAEWVAFQYKAEKWVEPAFREELVEIHRKVGPMAQFKSLDAYIRFDVLDRVHTLKPKLLLIRGIDDHGDPPEGEQAIHERVPGSRLVRMEKAGHFPAVERPEIVNPMIAEFIASL